MGNYIQPIVVALTTFPFLAILFTLPYIIYQYHKYGSIPILRTILIYSLILYLTTIYFLIILPLPPIHEVANYTTPTMQLVPFQFITDFIKETSLVLTNSNTYIKSLTEPYFYEVLYNFFLLIPFGMYLRYYFKCGPVKTILISLTVSLFFELTQLSGLYGIYPRPYRLFDVDDLIINTLGGMIGYLVTPLLYLVLPTKDKLDEISYKKGEQVTFFRRFVAFCIDIIIVTISLISLNIAFKLPSIIDIITLSSWNAIFLYLSVIGCCYIAIPILTKGRTIGKAIVRIKLIHQQDKPPKPYHYIIRTLILYIAILPSPNIFLKVIENLNHFPLLVALLMLGCSSILLLIDLTLPIQIIIGIFSKKNQLFYDKVIQVENKNTIKFIKNSID